MGHPSRQDGGLCGLDAGAIQRTLGAGGVTEFRGYRPASGSAEVVVTHEFANIAAGAGTSLATTLRPVS